MSLDRALQRRLLEVCAEVYPRHVGPAALQAATQEQSLGGFQANIAYLSAHRLIDCGVSIHSSGNIRLGNCTITASGLDFLADDGGLSAILGTVVVKLHADTIRDMLLAKADASALPAPEKSALRKQIKDLPAAVLRTLTTRAAQEGLAHVPDLWHWIRATTGI